MSDDDLRHFPKTPPESDEEWQRLHRAGYRSDQSWTVTRPVVALVKNWKAWTILVAVMAALKAGDTQALIEAISGAIK